MLIYDQTCAAEKRRRRKRGTFPDPPRRVLINEKVCEGCGDCSAKSNCLSVIPTETAFGRKRAIDQSSCNKDYSCVKGFCPSFVSVYGATPRRSHPNAPGAGPVAAPDAAIPAPALPSPTADRPWGILVTGVGGTGVITIGALLGMAAHIEGKGVSVLDMTGLAQKGGAVMSHVRIAPEPEDLHAARLAAGEADAVIGCDLVVAASDDALGKMASERTRAVINAHETATAGVIADRDLEFPGQALQDVIRNTVADDGFDVLDATALATRLMGDSIATNMFMLGYAWQKGLVPLQLASLERAIELNGVAVRASHEAFAWGRRAAVDLDTVAKAAFPAEPVPLKKPYAETLDEIVAARVTELTAYQNAAYAARYEKLVRAVETAEKAKTPGQTGLAVAVARAYFKLLAYKDEYEVARLYSAPEFRRQLRNTFEDGKYRMTAHLAPPLLARRDPATGELQKQEFGPWIFTAFRLLARLKGLRGTRLDVFGRTAERRMERQLIADYEATMRDVIDGLAPDTHDLAVEIAAVPDAIRGFGHIKERAVEAARDHEARLKRLFRDPAARRAARESAKAAAE